MVWLNVGQGGNMTLIVRDVGGKNKRRVNVPWEGLATTAQWVEQAGKGGKDFPACSTH